MKPGNAPALSMNTWAWFNAGKRERAAASSKVEAMIATMQVSRCNNQEIRGDRLRFLGDIIEVNGGHLAVSNRTGDQALPQHSAHSPLDVSN